MKFVNHAASVLAAAPELNDDHRADLHDLFYASKSPTELAQHLSQLNLHPDLKRQLLIAKNKPAMEPELHEKVLGAMSKIDRDALDIAERHPNVLKLIVSDALAGEE